jgi:hypothetical protein
MSQYTTSNETKFYQWVFEVCNYKLHHAQNKTNKPFASYNVYREWMKERLR